MCSFFGKEARIKLDKVISSYLSVRRSRSNRYLKPLSSLLKPLLTMDLAAFSALRLDGRLPNGGANDLPPPPPLQCGCIPCSHYNQKREKRRWPYKQAPGCTSGRRCECLWCVKARAEPLYIFQDMYYRNCLKNKIYNTRLSAQKPAGFYKE